MLTPTRTVYETYALRGKAQPDAATVPEKADTVGAKRLAQTAVHVDHLKGRYAVQIMLFVLICTHRCNWYSCSDVTYCAMDTPDLIQER